MVPPSSSAAPASAAPPDDVHWMRLALAQAQAAAEAGEVPVGAVVVRQGQLLATGRNNPVAAHDPSGHAEINALRAAAAALGNYRLEGCELFVTLEPCPMCAGALLQARLARVVFGAADPRTGAAGSVVDLFAQPALNHHTRVRGGVLGEACARPLQAFFRARRAQARALAQPLRDDALRTPAARFEAYPPPAALQWTAELPALAGLRLAWLDNGQPAGPGAPALLGLHGPGQWGELYRALWPLAGGRRLLVPDLIGHGRSDKPKKGTLLSPAWHAQVLDEWLRALAVGAVEVVAPPSMAAVVHALAERSGRAAPWLPLPPDAWRDGPAPAWLDAPFPDAGHRAALRAWGPAQPAATVQLTPEGLAALAQALGAPAPR
ncbi:tRNA adenosine(34) deaminase TadA [Xenophilus sp. Marseille-Q4582]|uniref:tRNA adenosine(34) deaminase TadA n=1 Tax=Xenophilus sp. Marseille-Q4582 TaxID=2866600 RepID=UPI001CE45BBF|nr:tRNA adenosine(34) deaminase TadA [Xenophilus sp. Marseille-Q4582]